MATTPRPGLRHRSAVWALIVAAGIGTAGCASASGSASSSGSASASGSVVSSSPAATLPAAAVSAPAPGPQSLAETGSTLLYPLFNEWASGYKNQFPNVTISTAGTGSSTGISAAAGGTADIGTSDAYLSSATAASHPAPENVPLAISAQVVSYNVPGVRASLKLNSALLAQMYQGRITRWNDAAIRALNPGVPLPGVKVVPVHRSDGSGDTFLFTSYLAKPGSSWGNTIDFGTTVAWPPVPGALAEKGNGGMVTACAATTGCVAYIGISYLPRATAAGLGEAQLLNRAGGYVLPDAASISAAAAGFAANTPANGTISLIDGLSAGGYPIVNYEYAIVSTHQPSAAKATTLRALLNWILTSGSSAAYLSKVDFQPLPSQVSAIAATLIARIG